MSDYIDGVQKVKLKTVDKPQIRMLSGLHNSGSLIGGVAQLGERLNGIQEASGSIPLISTNDSGYEFMKTHTFLFIIDPLLVY